MNGAVWGAGSYLGTSGGTIGGTAAGKILGLNPYGGEHEVWSELVYGSTFEGNEATERGTRLEPVVADLAAEHLGVALVEPAVETLFLPTPPGGSPPPISGSPDRLTEDGQTVIEIKTIARDLRGALAHHVLQTQHYMHLCGASAGVLVYLQTFRAETFDMITDVETAKEAIRWGAAKLHIYEVPADPNYGQVVDALTAWFDAYVTTKTPPPVDGSKACFENLRRASLEAAGEVPASEGVALAALAAFEAAEAYKIKSADAKAAKAAKDEADNRVRAALGDSLAAEGYGVRVTMSEKTRRVTVKLKGER